MMHVHTEIAVAEGWQECGSHSVDKNQDQIRLDHGSEKKVLKN